jgi:phosphohistidine phosphatase
MKTIYLLRHARAEERDEEVPDKERKLVESGIEDARTIAKNLCEEGFKPELILSGDPSRSLKTAKIFAKKLKIESAEIILNEKIYSADDAESLLRIIKGLDDKYSSVMMIGHDPSLSALAHMLIKSFTFELPKAGVFGIECKKSKWKDIVPGAGKVKFFMAPMKKKKVEKLRYKLAEIMGNKLEDVIFETIGESSAVKADRVRKIIKKRSRQIAGDFVGTRRYPSLKTMDEISLFFKLQEKEKAAEDNK